MHGTAALVCPCGLRYRDVKTGLDFASVRLLLHVDSADPADWKQKGRGGVLGLWHQIKRALWAEHEATCPIALMAGEMTTEGHTEEAP